MPSDNSTFFFFFFFFFFFLGCIPAGFDTLALRKHDHRWRSGVLPPAQFSASAAAVCDDIHVNSFTYDFTTQMVSQWLQKRFQSVPGLRIVQMLQALISYHGGAPTFSRNSLQRRSLHMLDVLHAGGVRLPQHSPLGRFFRANAAVLQRVFEGQMHVAVRGSEGSESSGGDQDVRFVLAELEELSVMYPATGRLHTLFQSLLERPALFGLSTLCTCVHMHGCW